MILITGDIRIEGHHKLMRKDNVAEWSKAPALGAGPKGRGFKPHRYHTFSLYIIIKIIKTYLNLLYTTFLY